MADTKICSNCGGILEEGFAPDFAYGGVLQACWMSGKVEKSFWTGIKDIGNHPQYPIVVYRYQKSGFLEAYAPEESSR